MFDISEFQKELTGLINRHSVDSYCNMHDFVLAEMLGGFIVRIAVATNEEWKLGEGYGDSYEPSLFPDCMEGAGNAEGEGLGEREGKGEGGNE
jgi:hypothetical protein